MHATKPMTVSTKLCLGVAFPVLTLVAFEVLLIEAARGKGMSAGFASMHVAFVSLVTVPALVLLNYWTLFVDWSRRSTLILGGLALPSATGGAMAVLIHGENGLRAAGAVVLWPFTTLLVIVLEHSWIARLFAIGWLTLILSLPFAARRMTGRRDG
jgi:hypothetical protein